MVAPFVNCKGYLVNKDNQWVIFSIINVFWLPKITSEWVLRIIFLIEIICLILMVLGNNIANYKI